MAGPALPGSPADGEGWVVSNGLRLRCGPHRMEALAARPAGPEGRLQYVCWYYLLVGVRGGKGGSRSFFVPKLQRGSGLVTILIAKQVQLSISRKNRAHWSISNYALCGWRGLTGRKKERHARRPRTGRSHPSLGLSVFSLSFFTGRSTTSLLRLLDAIFIEVKLLIQT